MPIVFSDQALVDLERAFAWYLAAGDLTLAERFRDAVGEALAHIARYPGTGSTRYHHTGIHGVLRFWTLRRFPYAVFYLAATERIDIVRVLHQASNIPQHLQRP